MHGCNTLGGVNISGVSMNMSVVNSPKKGCKKSLFVTKSKLTGLKWKIQIQRQKHQLHVKSKQYGHNNY